MHWKDLQFVVVVFFVTILALESQVKIVINSWNSLKLYFGQAPLEVEREITVIPIKKSLWKFVGRRITSCTIYNRKFSKHKKNNIQDTAWLPEARVAQTSMCSVYQSGGNHKCKAKNFKVKNSFELRMFFPLFNIMKKHLKYPTVFWLSLWKPTFKRCQQTRITAPSSIR